MPPGSVVAIEGAFLLRQPDDSDRGGSASLQRRAFPPGQMLSVDEEPTSADSLG